MPSLPRTVRALGFVSLFNDFSSEIVIRTLPLYLVNVLGAKTGIVGLIEGIADSTATILKLFSGWFSDKIGKRKPIVLCGYSLSAVTKPFLFFANSWLFVLAIRFADRVGKGLRTAPRDALIADSVDASARGKAFGFNRAMDPIGGILGLLVAATFIFYSKEAGTAITASIFQTLVIISIVPALIAVAILVAFVRDLPSHGRAALPSFSLRSFDPRFKRFILILVLFTLGNSSDAFLILRAHQSGMNLLTIFLMIAAFNFLSSVIAIPAGALSDRFGRRTIIISGWIVYAVLYAAFAFIQSPTQIWIVYTLYGVYYGLTEGVEKALVADLVPAKQRGTAFGIYNATIGVAALPASVIAGMLWQWFGFAASFIFGGALALIAALLLLLFVKK